MKNKVFVCIGLIAMFMTAMPAAAAPSPQKQPACYSQAKVAIHADMRKLWMDHTLWTSHYITSALAGLEDQKSVLDRLLQNQVDIGNAVKPYYGERAGNELTRLLKEHILIAGSLIDAAKNGNQAQFKKYNDKWYKNADDIALFLSKLNPKFWPKNDVKKLMDMHLKLTTDQVTARLKKDWKGWITAYDKGENHIIILADTLSEGLIGQFPQKFK